MAYLVRFEGQARKELTTLDNLSMNLVGTSEAFPLKQVAPYLSTKGGYTKRLKIALTWLLSAR